VFSLGMLGVAVLLVAMIWAFTQSSAGGGVSVKVISAGGTFFGAAGLVAAVWRRRPLLRLTSALTVTTGVILLTPTVLGLGERFGGLHGAGLVPGFVGRPSPFIGALLVIFGGVLMVAGSARSATRLAALTVIRVLIWLCAFWHLADVVLAGDVPRLFDSVPTLAVQVFLLATMMFSTEMLLRGDRGWLQALSGAGSGAVFARLILPLGLVPVAGGFLTMFGVGVAGYPSNVGYLLDIEITAVALLIMASWAMRSLWRERQGRESLARTLELSPVIVRGDDGLIRYWPSGCQILYGWTREEALGRESHELLSTQFPHAREEIEAALRRDGEWSGEVRQLTRSGVTRWVAVRWTLQQGIGPDGGSQVVETHTDITDLKLTSAALRDSEDYLAHAVAAYELGIADHDLRTNRTTFSPELERMVGVSKGALNGSLEKFTSMILAEDRERSWRSAILEVRARLPRQTHILRIRRPDGEVRDLHGVRRYIYDDQGELIRAIGIYMDVTAQHNDKVELEARGARLIEMHSMLAHVSRLSAMGEMAAALAHELNQPLTAVGNSVGAIEMLLSRPQESFDEAARARVIRAAKHAQAQAVRAGEIVRRLREFVSRGEADAQAENLEKLVDDALALALPNPASARVEIRLDLGREGFVVLADRVQIEQVMVNLIRNAVESMRDQAGARILTIAASLQQDMVAIQLADTGPGVAPEVIDRLFSPFQSTKSDGMGVGLSICRRIVEAHGGKMWLEQGAGAGADFRFTLPLFKAELEIADD
jgi:two-component system sensor kinase FixL